MDTSIVASLIEEYSLSDKDVRFSLEEVTALMERAEGWEVIWSRLYALLGIGLLKVCHWLEQAGEIRWTDYGASEVLRDEFVSALLENHYARGAANGMLLGNFSLERRETLLSYLLNRDFVRKRAYSYIARNHPRFISYNQPVDDDGGELLDQLEGGGTPETLRFGHEVADEYLTRQNELDRRLRNLRIGYRVTEKRIPVAVRDAGLQLHPRVDWLAEGMPAILRVVVENLESGGNDEKKLVNVHGVRNAALRGALEDSQKKLAGTRFAPRMRQRIIGAMNRVLFDYLLRPLDAESIKDLLGITLDDAYQRLSRYRKHLEPLLVVNSEVAKLLDGDFLMDDEEFIEDELEMSDGCR